MKMPKIQTVGRWLIDLVNRHRLTVAVGVVIVISVLLTSLNMWLYVRSGASGLDLSRPGYSDARDNLNSDDDEPEFSAEGELTESVIVQYLIDYRAEANRTSQLGDFDSETLSDEVLGFDINRPASTP